MERISELPQPIFHHILSLLSQEQSIQTCVLAKSWRYLGFTRPKLEFSESVFSAPWGEIFPNIVDKTIQRYVDQNLSIQEFLLEVSGVQSDIDPFLDEWIPKLFSLGGVKTFFLRFYSRRFKDCYALPQVVYQVESIQELNLEMCRLNKISSIEMVMFKNLPTLRLSNVKIEDETFEKMMSSCPLIQYLVLDGCRGLRIVKVKNAHNLKNFDCDLYRGLEKDAPTSFLVEIEVPTTLQSIRIGNCPFWYCHHNNKFFPNLKSLYLFKVQLSAESFDIFSSNNIPRLEELELSCCYGFEKYELSSLSIKRLIISMALNNSFCATIDTPNILYFKLSCDKTVSSPFSFTKTSGCEWKSNISMTCHLDSYNDPLSTWFLELDERFKALSQSHITLDIKCICSTKGQRIKGTYEGFKGTYEGFSEPVVVEHLSLSLSGSFPFPLFSGFLNYLFNICRPRYIYNLPKSYRESLQERESMDSLWQQDLEDISTEEEKDYDGELRRRIACVPGFKFVQEQCPTSI